MVAEIASAVVRRADGSVGARIDAIRVHGATEHAGDPLDTALEAPPTTADESTAYQVTVFSTDPVVPNQALDPISSYEAAVAEAEAAVG